MNLMSIVTCALLVGAAVASLPVGAAENLVRLEARCPDKTIEYEISRHALAEVQSRKEFRVVADNSADVIVRFSASPVRNRADDKAPPLGVALATLVQRRTPAGSWEIKRFGSAFVPLDDIQSTVKGLVSDALK